MTVFLTERLEMIDNSVFLLGIYTSFELAIERIEDKCGKLDWTVYPRDNKTTAKIGYYSEISILEIQLDIDID